MLTNIDGYKKIFFLENLLREYLVDYVDKSDLNVTFVEKMEAMASENGEMETNQLDKLVLYSHIGELADVIKSKAFIRKKPNQISKINVQILIRHRNNIMHSRSISLEEMEEIERVCDKVIVYLNDVDYQQKWNEFKINDIDNFKIPEVFIEYPIGKNFDRLIGRGKELKDLKFEITKPIPVSIVGHGGLGKTALVLQLIEDYIYSPSQPFENIYFMSFKNSVFENGKIRRLDKSITNHKDLILKLASYMKFDLSSDLKLLEEKVWTEIFNTRSLLILDNLETEIVNSNLGEFREIARDFTNNFTKPSRLIITSRYGLGDREAKLPLFQFDLENTKKLMENYLNADLLLEKDIREEDWRWIQSYTQGNPGLIIAFSNTLKTTGKKLLDLRVEYDTKYTAESRDLHNQLEEFLIFCFENTIESMNKESQIFLAILCYICSEADIQEINEGMITYLKDEVGLKKLGEENLRAQIFTNIGFLQPIPNSNKYYVNELYIQYLDGNYSDNIYNVFRLKGSEWYSKLEELKNQINEIQFNEELSLSTLLSELYMSKYKIKNDRKYLINAFYCEPTLNKLIQIYQKSSKTEVIENFVLLDKLQVELKDNRKVDKQNRVIELILKALTNINREILKRNINTIKQRDLHEIYKQLMDKIPILRDGTVSLPVKKLACPLLITFKDYSEVQKLIKNESKLITERFNLYLKQLGDLSGSNNEECITYIEECKEIIKLHPDKISLFLVAQYKLYSSRYFKKNDPEEALKILENFEAYFDQNNIKMFVFSLESLLIRMECLLKVNGDFNKVNSLKGIFEKYQSLPQYKNLFKDKRVNLEQNYRRTVQKYQNKIKYKVK
ncbi:hypothetical protein [Terribacillus aidingensis]|uniref:hypothetical protein n=1 Tax=Terribacillus aidingensis TaxID=586416 RepID=UPI00344B43C4